MKEVKKYVLLVSCPDRIGLVGEVSQILSNSHCNILEQGELVERQEKIFFMRVLFEGKMTKKLESKLNTLFRNNHFYSLNEFKKHRIIIMASKEYHCLGDILLKNKYNDLNAQIIKVISNHDVLYDLVDKFNLAFSFIKYKGDRHNHEKELIEELEKENFDYIVTAKYMRIFSPSFVQKYQNKIINIHHSFLPAFVGYNPYEQAYNKGVKIMGATAHYVTEDLDQGPIISQKVMNIDQSWSPTVMAQKGKQLESSTLYEALEKVLDQKVIVFKNKTIIF